MQALTDYTGENATLVGITRPLTIKQEPNKVIEVEEIWQFQVRCTTIWIIAKGLSWSSFEKWADHMYNLHDSATRIAYAQIEADNTGENQMRDKETLEQAFYNWEKKLTHGYGRVEIWVAGAQHQSAITRAEDISLLETSVNYYRQAAEKEEDVLLKNISFGVALELQLIINQINQLKTP